MIRGSNVEETGVAMTVSMTIAGDDMAVTSIDAEEMETVHRVSSPACMTMTRVPWLLESMDAQVGVAHIPCSPHSHPRTSEVVAEKDVIATCIVLTPTDLQGMVAAAAYLETEVLHRATLRGADLEQGHHLHHIRHAILTQSLGKIRAKNCFHQNPP